MADKGLYSYTTGTFSMDYIQGADDGVNELTPVDCKKFDPKSAKGPLARRCTKCGSHQDEHYTSAGGTYAKHEAPVSPDSLPTSAPPTTAPPTSAPPPTSVPTPSPETTTPTKLFSAICDCGGVQIDCKGLPAACHLCHCKQCRLARDLPVHWSVVWSKPQLVVIKGADLLTETKHTVLMSGFSCKVCSTLVYNSNRFGTIGTSALLFADKKSGKVPVEFKPTAQTFYDERVIDLPDTLPKYLDVPTELGGSGKLFDAST